ncbi:hypothetical protein QA802_40790 [Streptomyces sp. B21-105]|uniref:hypothetical protein n=1 Tax=Streptomyces sp. B21-105 TaxID=3039417 RepID=UPI002FF33F7A
MLVEGELAVVDRDSSQSAAARTFAMPRRTVSRSSLVNSWPRSRGTSLPNAAT